MIPLPQFGLFKLFCLHQESPSYGVQIKPSLLTSLQNVILQAFANNLLFLGGKGKSFSDMTDNNM